MYRRVCEWPCISADGVTTKALNKVLEVIQTQFLYLELQPNTEGSPDVPWRKCHLPVTGKISGWVEVKCLSISVILLEIRTTCVGSETLQMLISSYLPNWKIHNPGSRKAFLNPILLQPQNSF